MADYNGTLPAIHYACFEPPLLGILFGFHVNICRGVPKSQGVFSETSDVYFLGPVRMQHHAANQTEWQTVDSQLKKMQKKHGLAHPSPLHRDYLSALLEALLMPTVGLWW